MDRGRRTAALAFVLALGSLAASDAPPLAELRWLAPGADPVAAIGMQPSECLAGGPGGPGVWDEILSIEVGRAAFRSPLTLGGQAARAGVSCETCHRNGRTNPAFDFPGASGAPGTADVTSSLFSAHRGNGVDDPKLIPDLGGPRSDRKVSRDPATPALEIFIHGLVTQEFDGPEPSPAVLAGLAAYVRRIDPDACEPGARPVTAHDYFFDAYRAVIAAKLTLEKQDAVTSITMLEAARTRLGRLDERYAGLPRSQAALRRASADLADIEGLVRARDPTAAGRLDAWIASAGALWRLLDRDEPRSLFNHKRLAASARLPRQGR